MIVVDASVLANVVADDGPDGARVRRLLVSDGPAAMPDLADVETMAVLRKRWIGKTISTERFEAAVDHLAALPFRRYPTRPFLQRMHELRFNVTACDAVYVALAEALGCDLVTADARLGRASGPRCTIRVVT